MQISLGIDRSFGNHNLHNLIDMSKATVVRHGKKVRITLNVAESLVKEIDDIQKRIGVDRGTLIFDKGWAHRKGEAGKGDSQSKSVRKLKGIKWKVC